MTRIYRDTLFKSRNSTYVQRVGFGGAHWFKLNGRGAMVSLLRAVYVGVDEANRIAREYEFDEDMPAEDVFASTRRPHKGVNGFVVYRTQEGAGIEFSGKIVEIG